MKPPCELAVREFLPLLRAAIVRELSEVYNMKQTDIAQALGITQASVSQYLHVERGKEGRLESAEGFHETAKKIAGAIALRESSRQVLLNLVCMLCTQLRKSEEFCHAHQDMLNVDECHMCK